MTTEVRPVSQPTIVRHYRATTHAEAEQSYRADALKAARSGYVAVDQTWTEDDHGFLLAVVYGGPDTEEPADATPSVAERAAAVGAPVEATPAETEPEQPAAQPVYQPVQRITPVQPVEPVEQPEAATAFAPSELAVAAVEAPAPTVSDMKGAAPALEPEFDEFTSEVSSLSEAFAPQREPAHETGLGAEWPEGAQVD